MNSKDRLPQEMVVAAVGPAPRIRLQVIAESGGTCGCSGCDGSTHPGSTPSQKALNPCTSTFSGSGLPSGWTFDPTNQFADGTDSRDYRLLCPECTKRWDDLWAKVDQNEQNPDLN